MSVFNAVRDSVVDAVGEGTYSFGVAPSMKFRGLWYGADYAMTGVLIGTGSLTITRSTTSYALGSDGYYNSISANQPIWQYARYSGGVGYADDGAGSLLTRTPKLLAAPSMTNYTLYSADVPSGITAGDWAMAAGTQALDAVGLDGSANSASTIGDNSPSAPHVLTQTVTGITSNGVNTLVFYVKKDSNSTIAPSFHLRYDGLGTRRYAIDMATDLGDTAENDKDMAVASHEVESITDDDGNVIWWRLIVSATDEWTSSDIQIAIYPAYTSTPGSGADPALQRDIILGNVELYKGKTIAQVRSLPPIFTTSSAVPTGAQTAQFDDAEHSQDGGVYKVNWTPAYANQINSASQSIISLDAAVANLLDDDTTSGRLACTDDTNTATATTTWSALDELKLAVAFHNSGSMGVTIDGSAGSDATYDGAFSTGTTIDLGVSIDKVNLYGDFQIWTSGSYAQLKNKAGSLTS